MGSHQLTNWVFQKAISVASSLFPRLIFHVISWSWDSACDFKFYKCNIIRKCWHKHIIIWVSTQTIYSCKEQLPNISIKYFFIGRVGGRGRKKRQKMCIAERKYDIFIIYIYHVFLPIAFFWGGDLFYLNVTHNPNKYKIYKGYKYPFYK